MSNAPDERAVGKEYLDATDELVVAVSEFEDWISEQMGHSDIRTTKRFYARYTRPVHDRNVALLNEFAACSADVASHPRHDTDAAR